MSTDIATLIGSASAGILSVLALVLREYVNSKKDKDGTSRPMRTIAEANVALDRTWKRLDADNKRMAEELKQLRQELQEERAARAADRKKYEAKIADLERRLKVLTADLKDLRKQIGNS
jgi:Skp family chaperone for outer membrane proteins